VTFDELAVVIRVTLSGSNAHLKLSCVLLWLIGGAAPLSAQGFDASANKSLHGNYFVRQLACSGIASDGTNGRARSLTGTMAFDGAGSFKFTGQLMDTSTGTSTPASYSVSGTYALASNNLLQITSPLDPQLTMDGELGVSALVASSPTGGNADLLIAIPASTSPVTPATLQGTYWVGLIDFLHGQSQFLRDALFPVTANGSGGFADFAVSGNAVNWQLNPGGQVVSGATYSLAADGSGTAAFPVPSGAPVENQLIGGSKILYVSSDGSLLLGGASDGFDILVGVKALPGTVSDSNLQGLLYVSGIQVNFVPALSGGSVDWSSNSGSFNASGTGVSIWHQRLHAPGGAATDTTFSSDYMLGADGTVSESYYRYGVGAGGGAFILTGNADNYAFAFGVSAPPASGTGVFLNPNYVVNAANFAPITNPIAPGELVSLYGSGLAPSDTLATGTPYQSKLAGVSVTMNGLPAPLYHVSAGRIDAIVPFAAADSSPYINIQVNNGGKLSNSVMVYAGSTAPGVFTTSQSGVGDGTILHADYSTVTLSNPAHRGETVLVFLTGLGKTNPAVQDGAPGPSQPPANALAEVGIYIDGQPATVAFSGLAPLYPGLYQVNVLVPQTASSGDVYLDIGTPTAYHSQARIFIAPQGPASPAYRLGPTRPTASD